MSPVVSESEERHEAHARWVLHALGPHHGRMDNRARMQSEAAEEDAKGSPSSLGITKAENYKTKYKGRTERACERVIHYLVRDPCAPLVLPWDLIHFFPHGASTLVGSASSCPQGPQLSSALALVGS